MTSKIKCPVCGKTELIRMFNPLTGEYFEDYDCPFRLCNFRGNKVAVDALIQAKQNLEQYEHKDNLQQQLNANNNQIQEKYKQIVEIDGRIIENLEKDLQTAVQALEEIRDETGEDRAGFSYVVLATNMKETAEKALEQIEHKE